MKEFLDNLDKALKIFRDNESQQDYEGKKEFYFETKVEGIEKGISAGLNHLADFNPLNRVVIEVKENWDSENHPHSTFTIRMINLL